MQIAHVAGLRRKDVWKYFQSAVAVAVAISQYQTDASHCSLGRYLLQYATCESVERADVSYSDIPTHMLHDDNYTA